MQARAHSVEDMYALAAACVADLTPKGQGATIMALSGDLGAGKTTFVKGLAKALGVEAEVTSPTFVIEKIYALAGQKWTHLVHIDAYRLHSAEELPAIGWDELILDAGNVVVIEWPEQVDGAMPEGTVFISFKDMGDGTREISYDK